MKRHEKEHYQAMSDEWTKRMAENEANYQRKIKDLDTTQVRLVAEVKKHQAYEKQRESEFAAIKARLAERESALNAREAKLAQSEAQSTRKLAFKEAELDKRDKKLSQSEKAFKQRQEEAKMSRVPEQPQVLYKFHSPSFK